VVISTRELAALATDVATVLPSTAQIQRATATSDGAGGRSRSFSTVATVACRITPDAMGAREALGNDKIKDTEPYRVAFPAGTDVRLSDRVSVGGLVLSVEAVRQPRSVEVERVTFCMRAAA
jgi:head-tail adaptor